MKYKIGGKRKNREDCLDQISFMKGDDRRSFCPTQLHKPFRHLVPLGNCKANMGWTGIRPAALVLRMGLEIYGKNGLFIKDPTVILHLNSH